MEAVLRNGAGQIVAELRSHPQGSAVGAPKEKIRIEPVTEPVPEKNPAPVERPTETPTEVPEKVPA